MKILPLLIGLYLFLNKNNNSKLNALLKNVDIKQVLSILKELGVGQEILSCLTEETIEKVSNGKIDVQTFLPLAIKFFSNKKNKSERNKSAKKVSPLDDIASGEIKTCLYSYLNR